jgi:hypothetical protein
MIADWRLRIGDCGLMINPQFQQTRIAHKSAIEIRNPQ